ncbi:hypothetical protein [Nocardia cyriacigeorgica]|uniref:hypothetical protein n=1 Tax=Nocardia cyriacigeorgica TaxID=135487 RepID=UPI0024543F82|nr:hypothetical protein [Nocardia cyriacigeorgica]
MVSDRDTLDELISMSGLELDRGPRVADWPEDERNLHRSPGWISSDARRLGIQRLRRQKIADAILNAGFQAPRVIETAEQRDAMTIGAAVLDAFAAVCTRVHTDPVIGWVRATSAVGGGQHRHRPYLPATVLWEPEQEARR